MTLAKSGAVTKTVKIPVDFFTDEIEFDLLGAEKVRVVENFSKLGLREYTLEYAEVTEECDIITFTDEKHVLRDNPSYVLMQFLKSLVLDVEKIYLHDNKVMYKIDFNDGTIRIYL